MFDKLPNIKLNLLPSEKYKKREKKKTEKMALRRPVISSPGEPLNVAHAHVPYTVYGITPLLSLPTPSSVTAQRFFRPSSISQPSSPVPRLTKSFDDTAADEDEGMLGNDHGGVRRNLLEVHHDNEQRQQLPQKSDRCNHLKGKMVYTVQKQLTNDER